MLITFAEALRNLDPNAVVRATADARPGPSYIFSQFLPEIEKPDYTAAAGSMTIRSIMAGLVGMDSAYPPGGAVDTAEFSEKIAKVAIQVELKEGPLREIQSMMRNAIIEGRTDSEITHDLILQFLNFQEKLLTEPHLATAEWMRGQALALGRLVWAFNGKAIDVDYGIPTENIRAQNTGTNAYGGSTSKFWDDVEWHRSTHKTDIRAFVAHPEVIKAIRLNPNNHIAVTGNINNTVYTFRRKNDLGNFTADVGDEVVMISYRDEGEVYDLNNPGKTVKVPFMPKGPLIALGNNSAPGFVAGGGSTPLPANRLGYTHLGPTTENGGLMGRWARIYTPQDKPYQLTGEAVANLLPVVEGPELITISSTVLT